jgi:hypothetical protein
MSRSADHRTESAPEIQRLITEALANVRSMECYTVARWKVQIVERPEQVGCGPKRLDRTRVIRVMPDWAETVHAAGLASGIEFLPLRVRPLPNDRPDVDLWEAVYIKLVQCYDGLTLKPVGRSAYGVGTGVIALTTDRLGLRCWDDQQGATIRAVRDRGRRRAALQREARKRADQQQAARVRIESALYRVLDQDEHWRISLEDYGRWLEASDIALAQRLAPGDACVALSAVGHCLIERVAGASPDQVTAMIALLERDADLAASCKPLGLEDAAALAMLEGETRGSSCT